MIGPRRPQHRHLMPPLDRGRVGIAMLAQFVRHERQIRMCVEQRADRPLDPARALLIYLGSHRSG